MTLAQIDWREILEKAQEPVGLLGMLGQGVFFTRFAIQWIASERRKESVIPEAFWWVSIVGGTMTLVYGLLREELPIIAGQAFGNVVYVRNLVLVRRKRRQVEALLASVDEPRA